MHFRSSLLFFGLTKLISIHAALRHGRVFMGAPALGKDWWEDDDHFEISISHPQEETITQSLRDSLAMGNKSIKHMSEKY